jgi:hypothetical protein
MVNFKRKMIAKTSILFLTISIFCSLVLSDGKLFAFETVAQKDTINKVFFCQPDVNQSVFISGDRIVFDYLLSKPCEKENFVVKPLYSENTFLLAAFIKCFSKKSSSVYSYYNPSLKRIIQESLPSYLLYKNLRI